MPSTSKKQHNFFAAIAHSPSFAKKVGVPQSVGSDFVKADKGRKFAKGGDMKKIPPFMGKETPKEEAKEMAIKAKSPAKYRMGEKAEGIHGESGKEKPSKYAKGGFTKAADGVAQKGKTKAQQFDAGGMAKLMMAKQAMQNRRPVVPPPPVAARPSGRAQMMQRLQELKNAKPTEIPRGMMSSRRPVSSAPVATIPDTVGTYQNGENPEKDIGPSDAGLAPPRMSSSGPGAMPGAMKKGGCVKKMAKGGGCETKGKTKGRYI